MKRVLVTLAVVVLPILGLPATAQAVFEGCPGSTDVTNYVCSTQDGQTLVGTAGPLHDYFIIRDDNVTVYTEGMGDMTEGDFVAVQGEYNHDGSGYVTGTVIHADVYYDGDTDPTNDVPLPSAPNLTVPGGQNVYVRADASIDTTIYGSPDMDHVDDGNPARLYAPNTGLVFYGNDGNDDIDKYAGSITMYGGAGDDSVYMYDALGSISLNGNDGNDNIVDQQLASATKTAASVTRTASRSVKMFGGRGRDHIKALRHGDVVRAGKGYDVCTIVKGVETHGCEKIVVQR